MSEPIDPIEIEEVEPAEEVATEDTVVAPAPDVTPEGAPSVLKVGG